MATIQNVKFISFFVNTSCLYVVFDTCIRLEELTSNPSFVLRKELGNNTSPPLNNPPHIPKVLNVIISYYEYRRRLSILIRRHCILFRVINFKIFYKEGDFLDNLDKL